MLNGGGLARGDGGDPDMQSNYNQPNHSMIISFSLDLSLSQNLN